jgi:vancomycin resistance protein VanJ
MKEAGTGFDRPEAMHETPRPRPRLRRRLWRWAVAAVTWAALLGIVLGVIGQLLRDRNLLLALLMYVPIAPLGLVAILFDLAGRGRALRPRFMLTVIGSAGVLVGTIPMLGTKPSDAAVAGGDPLTLLHWNMQSGGRWAAQPRWERAAEQILSRQPDLIVLSEAPPDHWLFHSLHKNGRGYKTVHISNQPDSRYWYKPLVCSRWPMVMEGQVPVRNGVAMAVAVRVRGRPLRLLVVDGVSQVTVLRTPFLQDIARACDAAAKEGRPFDVVVGDFNAPGRSVGFDAVRSAAGGYKRASDYSGGWRGTWPVPLPVYDIDHVFTRSDAAVTGCEMFSSLRLDTDHRGQFVTLALPPVARAPQ